MFRVNALFIKSYVFASNYETISQTIRTTNSAEIMWLVNKIYKKNANSIPI